MHVSFHRIYVLIKVKIIKRKSGVWMQEVDNQLCFCWLWCALAFRLYFVLRRSFDMADSRKFCTKILTVWKKRPASISEQEKKTQRLQWQ